MHCVRSDLVCLQLSLAGKEGDYLCCSSMLCGVIMPEFGS